MKTVFVNPERCIGCRQCETACAVAHSQSNSLFLSVFETPLPKPRIHVEQGIVLNTSFPNKCRHCDPAPCMGVCPTGAIHRSEEFPEIVLIDEQKCIACAMCGMVCPFGVITYHPSARVPNKTSVAIKCDHCIERQRIGDIPACVEVCKVNALMFGEANQLIQQARSQLAIAVSAASATQQEAMAEQPLSVEIWRKWGASVSSLNENGKKGA